MAITKDEVHNTCYEVNKPWEFMLSEIPRIGKLINTESTFMVAYGWGQEGENRGYLLMGLGVIKRSKVVVMVTPLCEYAKLKLLSCTF